MTYTSTKVIIDGLESNLPVSLSYMMKTSPYTIVLKTGKDHHILKNSDLEGVVVVENHHAMPYSSNYLKRFVESKVGRKPRDNLRMLR